MGDRPSRSSRMRRAYTSNGGLVVEVCEAVTRCRTVTPGEHANGAPAANACLNGMVSDDVPTETTEARSGLNHAQRLRPSRHRCDEVT